MRSHPFDPHAPDFEGQEAVLGNLFGAFLQVMSSTKADFDFNGPVRHKGPRRLRVIDFIVGAEHHRMHKGGNLGRLGAVLAAPSDETTACLVWIGIFCAHAAVLTILCGS